VQAMTQQRAQQQQQQQMLAALEQGSNAAANFAGASKDVAESQGNNAARDSFSPIGMAA